MVKQMNKMLQRVSILSSSLGGANGEAKEGEEIVSIDFICDSVTAFL